MEEAKSDRKFQVVCGIKGVQMGRQIPSETPPNYGWGQEGCRYNGIKRFNTKDNVFHMVGMQGGVLPFYFGGG